MKSHMIYVIAIVLSLVVTWQCLVSEIVSANIAHLKNGRQPNAGAAIFPAVPFFQFLAIGVAWLLHTFVPRYALWIFLSLFLLFTVIWAFSFRRLKADLARRLDDPA